MKKKVLSLVLAVTMAAVALVGCGNNAANTNTNAEVTEETTEETTEEVVEEVEVTDVALKVWCPQNQIDNGSMDEMCAMFQEDPPKWTITFTV